MANYTVPAGRYGDYSTAFIQAYIDQKIADVIDQSPEALDTLNELAAAIGDDPAFFTSMATANTTLQTNIDTVQANVDALTTAASDARDALQALLQADIDQNESDADAAILAETNARGLAIAAVQSDVDQNEADADAAIALKANIADPDFTGLAEFVRGKVTNPSSNISDNAFYVVQESNGNFGLQVRSARLGLNVFTDRTNPADVLFRVGDSTTPDMLEVYSSTGGTKVKNVFDAAGGFKLAGTEVTATADELNILDGVTATAAELNYVDGVTSNIQTQLDAIQADVDTNESDADAAIALKAPLADPDFTGLAEFVRSKVTNPSSNASDNALYVVQESFGNFGIQCRSARLGLNVFTDRTNAADVLFRVGDSTTNNLLELFGDDGGFQVNTDIIQHPSASVTPANNGELVVEATNNTTLTFKLKGSDGTVRSGTITLS